MRGSCVECNSVRLTRRWVIASQATTACFAGGSATRNAHRRRSRMLRLRCAPPSARSNVIHARASESGHLKRSFGSAPKRISAPEDSLRGELARARARQEPRSSAQSTSRALVVFAVAAAAAPFGVSHARASESGHLKRSFGSAPKRISAPEDSLRGELARARARQEPRSSAQTTLRALVVFAVAAAAAPFGVAHARASKGGGREPQVRPAASCERSN
jgi:hypothetical protein